MTGKARQELSAVARASGPLCAVYAADIGMYLVDMAVVGRLGLTELAGVAVAEQLIFLVIALLGAISSIIVVLISRAVGDGNLDRAIRLLQQGMLISIVLGVTGMIFVWNVDAIFRALGYGSDVVGHAKSYARAVAWCVVPYLLFLLLRGFLVAVDSSISVMPTVLAAVVANIPISYVMTFGCFGIAGLGVSGAGFSTSIVSLLMVGSLLRLVQRRSFGSSRMVRVFKLELDGETWLRVLRKGVPAALSTLLEDGMFVVAGMISGIFGGAALVAHYLANSVVNVAMVFANGIGDAVSIRVAFHGARGDTSMIRVVGKCGMTLACVAISVMSVLMLLKPATLAGAFVSEENLRSEEIMVLLVPVFATAAICQIFEGLQVVAMRGLRGLEDTFVPMCFALCGYWLIALPLALGFAHGAGWGVQGVWLGLTCGLAVTALALVLRFRVLTKGRGSCASDE